MNRFIPTEKLSKKAQKELNRKKRRTWGAIKPVTRKPANPKAYKRKKIQRDDETLYPSLNFFIFYLSFSHSSALNPTNAVS